jgi:CheY-like chemotaxis protein
MTAKRRILVVDDAEGIRSYLASLLELRGFRVDTAEDGLSALALLESGAAPDLIILDVMMPGIDGLETLRRIRARDAEVPVVMLSVVGKATAIVEAHGGVILMTDAPGGGSRFSFTLPAAASETVGEGAR